MNARRYHIATGYHESKSAAALFPLWIHNTCRFASPQRISVLADSGAIVPGWAEGIMTIHLSGNLGHFMNLLNKEKPHDFNGWSGAVMALAMIAYCDECDFIFKEQDCLAFGNWTDRLYEEIGHASAIWGNCSFMPCEQSLFMVRHSGIPDFVKHYLDGPPQTCDAELGEKRFVRMEQKFPLTYKRFTFGSGRDRPIPWRDPVFYFQQPKPEDLAEAKSRGFM